MTFSTAGSRRAGMSAAMVLAMGAHAEAKVLKHHQAATPAPSADTVALQAHVKALEDQVAALLAWRQSETSRQAEVDQQTADLRRQLDEAKASASAAKSEVDARILTIPSVVKTQVDAARPKDGKVPYKGVTVTLGGFLAAETAYRSKNEEADIGSSFSKIPFANAPLAHTDELRGTARQSRLSLLAEGRINPHALASFYTELDFLAGPQTANSNESNSFSPRIRNVYGTLDLEDLGLHVLAGQNWSLATLNGKGITPRNELPPSVIDAQYVAGFSWTRQPQFRVTKDFANKQVWAAFSLENPQTTFAGAATGVAGTAVPGLTVTTTGTSTSQFDNTNTLSLNHTPDIIGKVAVEPELFGARPLHVEAYGLYRSYYDRVNVTSASNVLGLPVGMSNRNTDGGGFGWGVTWTAIPRLVDLETSGLTGRGIGRYGSGQLPDTVVGPDGALKAIPETMLLAGGTVHASRALDVYVFAGQEREKALYGRVNGAVYGFGAPTANLAGCATEGATCSPNIRLMTQISAGLWDKVYQGKFGQVRVGLQYSYTDLTAFPGATGLQPKTHDDMIFTSVRYYPF